MKATIEFNLPEDDADLAFATKAGKLWMFQEEFYSRYRHYWKYAELTENEMKIIEEFKEHMDDFKVEFDVE